MLVHGLVLRAFWGAETDPQRVVVNGLHVDDWRKYDNWKKCVKSVLT